ncbi:quinol:electron acceptor oxidoreductase subunit ActD [Botrimarina hoheduenensis]|uniref:Cytochrome c domain-containing protein n=1 Tax=Botrimarina hoheduenensis TaxID=2528000 RepID=A0A5C5W839_9BACT|nr:quinol:electron acceptor oxidoreductase subunit ActD [Botrimarina hoheduenensis]TWT46754.1 hypothetical protein Pla111_18550 [Botrimarina hoheduenensis]
MSKTHPSHDAPQGKRLGLLAQFAGPEELVAAAEKATDAGYQRVEAFSPFPVLGIDEALKNPRTILPYVVLMLGLSGMCIALLMQCYMNGMEFPGAPWGLSGYDFLISGKPSFSIPAFIPVTFEVIILLSAFGAFFGMILLNGLPKLSNPLFRSERFAAATDDGFFLFVEASDPKFAEAETEAFLSSLGGSGIEGIDEPVTGHAVPGFLYLVGAAVATLALLPPMYLWATSGTTSTVPRISFFKDMENQPKVKPQTTFALFKDGRGMRVAVPGTVARGGLKDDAKLYFGYEPEDGFVGGPRRIEAMLASYSVQPVADGPDADGADSATPPAADQPKEENWVTEFPVKVTKELMERGQQRFNIHCAVCHGLDGGGMGLVTKRALELEQGTWTQPTSVHAESVVEQPVGKLFNTISNGVRKMPGYKEHIAVEDRWAIVLYLRAIQRSQLATADDLPKDKLIELSNLN